MWLGILMGVAKKGVASGLNGCGQMGVVGLFNGCGQFSLRWVWSG